MWSCLPITAFSESVWRTIPAFGWHAPQNLLDWQAKAAIGVIDRGICELRATDPTMYYSADFDALLERRHALVERLRRGPVA